MDLQNLAVETRIIPINALQVEFTKEPKACKSRSEIDRNTKLVMPDGRKMDVSQRFWGSFSSLFAMNRSIFDYFAYGEVFERINAVKKDMVRVTLETRKDNPAYGTLLSCTNPTKPILPVDDVRGLINKFAGQNVVYQDGVVAASFDTPFPLQFQIAGDDFKTRFSMQMPIDGYGLPAAYLELLRLVCTNGAIGLTKAFKTQFQLGKEDQLLGHVLDRAMNTFNNEEGYHSYKARLESATGSWASYHESSALHTLINTSLTSDGYDLKQKMPIFKKFDEICGNPLSWYGMTSGKELSQRKARSIPVQATIYDLFNFASEVATHHLTSRTSKARLNAWIGETVTNEYDMEGTVSTHPNYADFFLGSSKEKAKAIPAA